MTPGRRSGGGGLQETPSLDFRGHRRPPDPPVHDELLAASGHSGCGTSINIARRRAPGLRQNRAVVDCRHHGVDVLPDPGSPLWLVRRYSDASELPPVGDIRGWLADRSGDEPFPGAAFLRGMPEDYDSWATAGNDEWGFEKVLPFFRKLETDTDYRDDFHGTEGPIIARRFKQEEWPGAQTAFYNACLAAGHPDGPDQNDP